ncbi:MAG: peptidylprolyl isomerase [Candidatus Thermoplasmatota archaeon]|jgi:peptidylprolyl isomerase|nr:peptidylprolyl isomerase [Candidatus Thermoplasmatota archaeon]
MNDGDFIKINFEMYVGEDRKLVSTNNEQLAKDNSIFDEKLKYKETVLIVGSENLFPEINESFRNAETGKDYEVVITAENAYGVRDSKNIRVHTVREFQRQKVDPVPGQEISINGKRGRVISVTPGRVLVDYNHQWAGKSVLYKYNIAGIVDDAKEKIKALIDYNYNVDSDKFQVSIGGKDITVTVPEETKFDPVWIEAKYRLVNDIRKHFPSMDIMIVESYKGEEKKIEETAPADAASAEKPEKAESKSESDGSKIEQEHPQ